MGTFCQITLVGYVGNVKRGVSGNEREFVSFSIAHNTSKKDPTTNQWKTSAQWYTCITSSQSLLDICEKMEVGTLVCVSGSLTLSAFNAKSGPVANATIFPNSVKIIATDKKANALNESKNYENDSACEYPYDDVPL